MDDYLVGNFHKQNTVESDNSENKSIQIEKSHFFHGSGTTSRNSLGILDELLFLTVHMKGYAALRSWGTSVLWTSWCISSWLYTCSTSAHEKHVLVLHNMNCSTHFTDTVLATNIKTRCHTVTRGYMNVFCVYTTLCSNSSSLLQKRWRAEGASGSLRSSHRLTLAGCV